MKKTGLSSIYNPSSDNSSAAVVHDEEGDVKQSGKDVGEDRNNSKESPQEDTDTAADLGNLKAPEAIPQSRKGTNYTEIASRTSHTSIKDTIDANIEELDDMMRESTSHQESAVEQEHRGAATRKESNAFRRDPPAVDPPVEPPAVSPTTVTPLGEEGAIEGILLINSVTDDMWYIALTDYTATDSEQLSLVEGQAYIVITYDYGNGWAHGCSADGQLVGVFPQTYVAQQTKQG